MVKRADWNRASDRERETTGNRDKKKGLSKNDPIKIRLPACTLAKTSMEDL